MQQSAKIIIYGDFNFRNLKWKKCGANLISHLESGSLKNVQLQIEETLDFMSSYYLEQKVSTPSRGKNFLDLMFTNCCSFQKTIEVDTSISDHRIIDWALDIDCNLSKPCQDVAPVAEDSFDVFDFRSNTVNWGKVCSELIASEISFNPELSLDCNLELFFSSCKNALKKCQLPTKSQKKESVSLLIVRHT